MRRVLTIAIIISSLNAGGTAPNTSVNNTATLNYNVGGTAQTELSASDSGFVVDRKILRCSAIN